MYKRQDEDKDVMIPKISLEKGAASLYRINVDGKAGTDFNNIPLRKKDSLYTVSYTHLDVYKRQFHYFRIFADVDFSCFCI